jgi:mRNA interferase RelE/StbE
VDIRYRKRFLKQLASLPPTTRGQIEKFAFDELPAAQSIADPGCIEKMQGYQAYFKSRFGSYRVGMKLEGDILILQLVMNRKDIYKYFP